MFRSGCVLITSPQTHENIFTDTTDLSDKNNIIHLLNINFEKAIKTNDKL